jgi:hypothetical protein
VIGGGLLGLEAARGLLERGLEVHVVHLRSHLMEMQLDAPAGHLLRATLEQMGVNVHLDKATSEVLGEEHVEGLAFADGSTLPCDMVVVSAGIRPNVALAIDAGLMVERGIVVTDELRCRATRACTRSANARSIADSCTGSSRRSGSRRRCWPTDWPAASPTRVHRLAGLDEAEGDGDRPRRDGRSGPDEHDRRGGDVQRAVAWHLQEARRARWTTRRRDPAR